MSAFADIAVIVLMVAVAICYLAAIVAHIALQFSMNHARIEADTGKPSWKFIASSFTPREFFKEEVWWLWKVRRYGFIVSLSAGTVAIIGSILFFALGGSLE